MEESEKYLYPASRIPTIGHGDNYDDYMLSQVFASHGCVIRRIEKHEESGKLSFDVWWRRYKDGEHVESWYYILIPSECIATVDTEFPLRYDDLRLRYIRNGSDYLRPVCIDAYAFGNGHPHCPVFVMRSETNTVTRVD